MPTNSEIVRKAAIQTTSLSSGLLNPEQARKFIQQTFETTNLGGLVRHEMRTAKTGEIDKIGIGRRILRKKTENTDDGYRAGVQTGQIEYATTAVRLPWEITEETLRENIEGQNFETIVTNLMTTQLGIDLEDLYLNGDEEQAKIPAFSATAAYSKGDKVIYDGKLYEFSAAHAAGAWTGTDVEKIGTQGDVDFLKINNGWIRQISEGGHVYDASSDASMSLDLFYKALATLPNKYNNGKLRWLMSPRRAQEWELFLLNQVISKGGAVPEGVYKSPASIPTVECPSLDDATILLTDPKNLIVVNTYSVKIRKTTEGEKAIMMDKRFYVTHLDYDPVIEELDATAIIKGLK
jgi:hypothetical protein